MLITSRLSGVPGTDEAGPGTRLPRPGAECQQWGLLELIYTEWLRGRPPRRETPRPVCCPCPTPPPPTPRPFKQPCRAASQPAGQAQATTYRPTHHVPSSPTPAQVAATAVQFLKDHAATKLPVYYMGYSSGGTMLLKLPAFLQSEAKWAAKGLRMDGIVAVDAAPSGGFNAEGSDGKLKRGLKYPPVAYVVMEVGAGTWGGWGGGQMVLAAVAAWGEVAPLGGSCASVLPACLLAGSWLSCCGVTVAPAPGPSVCSAARRASGRPNRLRS